MATAEITAPTIEVDAGAALGTHRSRHAGRAADRWERRYVFGLLASDAVVGLLAAGAASLIRFAESPATIADSRYLLLMVLLPVVWLSTLAMHRCYDPRLLFVGNEEYQRVLRAGLSLTAAVAIGSYALQAQIARGYVLIAIPAAVIAGVTVRYVLRHRLRAAWADGRCLRRVLVVGHERSVVAMARQLRHERYHGMDVVAACLPAADGHRMPARITGLDLPVYGSFAQVGDAVRAAMVDSVVVLACPELDGPELRRLAWTLERLETELIVASALLDVGGERTTLRPVDGLPMLHVEHPRLAGAGQLVKAVSDRVLATVLLVLLGLPLLAVAAMVRFSGSAPGPAFFQQTRVGRDGVPFRIWKLRTMYVDAEHRLAQLRAVNDHDGVLFKLREDPRITPLGRWLRRFSVDELPQLLNVIRGHMSLVGPRPPLPEEVARYPSDMHRRMAVRPGITGLWQVSGRSDLSWEETMRLDLRYVENWSLTLDLVIVLRTLTAVVRRSGAY